MKSFIKDEDYLAPTCKVYSVNLERVMLDTSTSDQVDPSQETDEYGLP